MFCRQCGKEIMDEAVICPSCGCSTQRAAVTSQGMIPSSARTAQILGIVAIVLLYPLGIPAIILANKSKAETNGVLCGPAKAGLICGIVALGFWAIGVLIFSLAFVRY